MQDIQENGYWSDDDDEEMGENQVPNPGRRSDDKYSQNLDGFLRNRDPQQLSEPLRSYSSVLTEKNNNRRMLPPSGKMRKRSLSIPASRKQGSIIGDPILSRAPKS